MRINDVIIHENIWKELYKNVVDNSVNFNNYKKNILKMGIECYFKERKNNIINNYLSHMNK